MWQWSAFPSRLSEHNSKQCFSVFFFTKLFSNKITTPRVVFLGSSAFHVCSMISLFLVKFRFSPEWKWKIICRKISYHFAFRMVEEVVYCMEFWVFPETFEINFQRSLIADNPELLPTATHIVCPKCNSPTNTNVEVKNTMKTHIIAFLMSIFWWEEDKVLYFRCL